MMEIGLGRVLNSLPSLVWTVLPDGQTEFVNQRLADYAGIDVKAPSRWRWMDAIDSNSSVFDAWRSIEHAGAAGRIEASLRDVEGVARQFRIEASPVPDEAGHLTGWCFTAIDIDAEYQERRALMEREADTRLIMDNIPNLVSLLTATGGPDLINRQIIAYTGRTEEELKRWGSSDLVHPDDLTRAMEIFKNGMSSDQPFEIVYRMRRFDGEYRWFLARHIPLIDEAGRIRRWCVAVNDINDSKRAEEVLRESDEHSRAIINGIPGFAASLAPDGTVEFVNRQILEYTGQTLEELKSWGTNGTVHPDDLAHVAELFLGSVAAGIPYDIEQRLRRYDGAYRWFSNRGIPAFGADGRVLRWHVLLIDIDDYKQAQAALIEREREARSIFDRIPILVATRGPDGVTDSINVPFLEYLGLPEIEVRNWGSNGVIHADDLPVVVHSLNSAIAAGQPYEFETRLRRADGTYRWFQVKGLPYRDDFGRILKWYGVCLDVHDRRLAEERLRKSERELGLMVHTVAGMICLFTPEGQLNGGNQQLLDYFQRPLEEIANWATNGITHPDDLQHCIDSFMWSIKTGEPYDFETRFRRFDGAYRWFQIRGKPLRDVEGRIIRWYGLLTDVDDKKRAEDELRRSQTFLETGQKISQTGIFSWRIETDELTFSDELNRIFEFDPATEITFEKILARVHPDDLPMLAEQMALVRSGFDNPEYEIRLRGQDGNTKHVRVVGQIIEHKDGRKECLGAVQDVTQRRLAEESRDQLRTELDRVTGIMGLGQMAASIAHEVNQPLAGIITNASTCMRMLTMDPPDIDVALETARRTIRDGNRAADVISRLRALFSRRSVAFEALDLAEAVQEVITLSSAELRRSGIVVRVELASQLPPVAGDRVQLQQVMLNLIRNAADAMKEIQGRSKTLSIIAELDEEGDVQLSVHDTGTGFHQKETDRIFEAFYTTKSDGMGIGLSVSRTIIESHNGRLWAKPNDGPGATVCFSIPQIAEEDDFRLNDSNTNNNNAAKAARIT